MIVSTQQYPRFNKGSPSTEYQQIINFCVNYLEGMLVGLIHIEISDDTDLPAAKIEPLQKRLSSRERTVRHAFQFQIEKSFSDFKSISRSRLKINYSHQQANSFLSGNTDSRAKDLIESISKKHQIHHLNQLRNTAKRLKTLVHRTDDNLDDNPISPLNLTRAFLASIETLNFSAQKNCYLLQLFDQTLNHQLANFYNQIDLGLYYLDILVELTDPALFLQPEVEQVTEDPAKTEVDPGKSSSKSDNPEVAVDEARTNSSNNKADTNIKDRIDKVQHQQLKLNQFLNEFKQVTENGNLDFPTLFSQLKDTLSPLLSEKQQGDLRKFIHFFTSLLNNSLLSNPLKTQLSRLSSPLLEIVLIDPFFFRSSSHPVNDFLLSIVDFELRFKHQGESLSILSQLIDALLEIDKPSLSDYQPLIEDYDKFKDLEAIRLEKIKEEKLQQEESLKAKILQLINNISAELVVDQQTLKFFYDDWQLLLIHIAKKQGETSAEFKNSVNIAKMLCWFLNHNKSGPHPRYESTSFKSLLTSIEIGLVTLNFSSEHRHRVRKQLVHEYKQSNESQLSFSVMPSFQKKTSTSQVKLADKKHQQTDEKSLQAAKELSIGNWVEIRTSANSPFNRAKLKWKSKDDSLFVFIDQRGHKIKECNFTELGQQMAAGNIRLLKKPTLHLNIY